MIGAKAKLIAHAPTGLLVRRRIDNRDLLALLFHQCFYRKFLLALAKKKLARTLRETQVNRQDTN